MNKKVEKNKMRIGFDNEKYLAMQSEHIRERIAQFDNKLYLETGSENLATSFILNSEANCLMIIMRPVFFRDLLLTVNSVF